MRLAKQDRLENWAVAQGVGGDQGVVDSNRLGAYQRVKALGSRVKPVWQSRSYNHAAGARGRVEPHVADLHMDSVQHRCCPE